MPSSLDKQLAERIRAYRATAGITQADLAERVEVEPETISRAERAVNIPSLATLNRIAAALGIQIRDLFELPSDRSAKGTEIDTFVRELKRLSADEIRFVRQHMNWIFEHFPQRKG